MDYSQSHFYSVSHHLIGAQSQLMQIPPGSKLVHADFLQSGTASNTWIECGGMQLSRNFARDAESDLAFVSTTTCYVMKTGNDESFVTVIFASGTPVSMTDTLSPLVPSVLLFVALAVSAFVVWIFNLLDHD